MSARESRTVFWHGGPSIHGDLLLPPSETGTARCHPGDEWVYVTPTRSLAETYAGTCRGWVYEVEALGDVEQDPDSILLPGESLRCPRARILRRFRLSNAECDRISRVFARVGGYS